MNNSSIDYVYLTFRFIHLCSVIFWMAGMLYLPRLFVYHSRTKIGSESYSTFLTMERRLMKIIMNPAAIAVAISGIYLFIYRGGFHGPRYLPYKLVFASLMYLAYWYLFLCYKDFKNHKNKKKDRFYIFLNEVPSIITIIIIFLAVFVKNIWQ